MKLFSKLILLSALSIPLFGCSSGPQAITNKDESTIIKDAKNVDEYLSKKDYNSLAYAYIYKIKEGAKSYKSETTGNVTAKVLFFDYDINYTSITYKNGKTFYSKDHSTSTFKNIDNEFYMVDDQKILVSNDLKKYDVYSLEDYHQISYTPNQYTVMGYVFNDQSIIASEVLEDKGEVVKVKYTLDSELATNLVRLDFKNNGDLSEYPTFKKVNVTLAMKRDFTPISYAIDAIYEASKAILGTTEVTQKSECLFSEVGENITIPNETFLAEKLGAKPSTINLDDTEKAIKRDIANAFEKLDYQHGVHASGVLALNLAEDTPITLNIDANAFLDMSRVGDGSLYDLFGLHANLEADENFSSLISLIKMFAADKLGDFAPLLESLKSLEIVYDGQGSVYMIPTNQDDEITIIGKFKLTDIFDLVLQNMNLTSLVSGFQNDTFNYEKKNGSKAGDYEVEVSLNEETTASIKDALDAFFEDSTYSIIKTILDYKDFDSVKATIVVKGGVVDRIDASLNYLKEGSLGAKDQIVSLLTLGLAFENETYDFDDRLEYAEGLYETYTGILELKSRLEFLLNNVYVSKGYLADLDNAVAEYSELTDQEKAFIDLDVEEEATTIKEDVLSVMAFIKICQGYDLSNLDNNDILGLATAYFAQTLKADLLKAEIGEEDYEIISNLESQIDYSLFDSAITKINGDDETAWGLTQEEIVGVKLIIDISKVISSVSTSLYIKLLMGGVFMSVDDLEIKINNLYESNLSS